MKNEWLRKWWERLRAKTHAPIDVPPGYRVPGVPTADEMAQRCRRLEAELEAARQERDRACSRLTEYTHATKKPGWPVPGLSPAELERLALLAEECGELLQAIGKVLRHGWQSVSPLRPMGPPNRVALERELGDLHAAAGLMFEAGDIRSKETAAWRERKERAIARWLHHQGKPAQAEETGTGQ